MLRDSVVGGICGVLFSLGGLVYAQPAAPGACTKTQLQQSSADTYKACDTLLAQQGVSGFERAQALALRGRSIHQQGLLAGGKGNGAEMVKDFQAAADDYIAALQINESLVEPKLYLGWLAYNTGNRPYASQIIDILLKEGPEWKGEALMLAAAVTDDDDQGLRFLEDASQAAPKNSDILSRLAGGYNLRGRKMDALKTIERALLLPDEELDSPEHEVAYERFLSDRFRLMQFRASLLSQFGRYEEADLAYEALVKRFPTGLSYALRANAYRERRADPRLVKADAEKAMSIDPDDPVVVAALAGYYEWQRDLPSAEKLYARVLQLDPGNAGLRLFYATLLRQLEQPQRAVEEALLALKSSDRLRAEKVELLRSKGFLTDRSAEPAEIALKDAVTACMIDRGCRL